MVLPFEQRRGAVSERIVLYKSRLRCYGISRMWSSQLDDVSGIIKRIVQKENTIIRESTELGKGALG